MPTSSNVEVIREQEIGRCSICGGWVVVVHPDKPSMATVLYPFCVTCGAHLTRKEFILPMTEDDEPGPWETERTEDNAFSSPEQRRAYRVGLKIGYEEGARIGFVPDIIVDIEP